MMVVVCPVSGAYWPFSWAVPDNELTAIIAAAMAATVADKVMRLKAPSFHSAPLTGCPTFGSHDTPLKRRAQPQIGHLCPKSRCVGPLGGAYA